MVVPIKINEKILCIPPYISTNWTHVAAIQMKGDILVVTLTDWESIYIPNLKIEHIELIFRFHAEYLEKELAIPLSKEEMSNLQQMSDSSAAVRFTIGSPLEGFGMMMNHNPSQANAPDLPSEILEKICTITKIIGPSDSLMLPQAEPECNCFHCQIARAVNDASLPHDLEPAEEEVNNEDLQFEQWQIAPVPNNEKLYDVINKLDPQEKYHVFLGDPIGCTCGKTGCEHILAVLKS